MKVETRHCAAITALALAALWIVWPRWLAPDHADPCARPDVLTVTGLIRGTVPAGERRERLSRDLIQWSEGTVPDLGAPRDPLVFRIVRNYDVLKAAERPLMLLPQVVEPEDVSLELADAPGGPLPIHVVKSTGSPGFHVVAYLYAFGNEPVDTPFFAQLGGVFDELRGGRRPLTVFLVSGRATEETLAARRARAIGWIVDAWAQFQVLCVDHARHPSRAG